MMTTSSSPFPYTSSPSFLIPFSKLHSLTSFNSLKFTLHCTPHTIQQESLQSPKKKRKPRPSFVDKIQHKWSVKPISTREKFPWQEQVVEQIEQVGELKRLEDEEVEEEKSGFGGGSKVFLPPWAQGKNPRKSKFIVKDENLQSFDIGFVERKDFDGVVEKNPRNSMFNVKDENWQSFDIGFVERKDFDGVVEKNPRNSMFNVKDENLQCFGIDSVERKDFDGVVGGCDHNVEEQVVVNSTASFELLDEDEDENFDGVNGSIDNWGDDIWDSVRREPKGMIKQGNDGGQGGKIENVEVKEVRRSRIFEINGILDIPDEGEPFRSRSSLNDDKELASVKVVSAGTDSSKLPWIRSSDEVLVNRGINNSNTDLAEKLIPQPELKRLRNMSLRMVERIKVGAAGVTEALVDSIREKWRHDEVVKLKFEGPPAVNMKRTHEFLESRTGGLVIWRSGSSVVLFRGLASKLPCVQLYTKEKEGSMSMFESSGYTGNGVTNNHRVTKLIDSATQETTDSKNYLGTLSDEELAELSELDHLLDELGPRYKDWTGRHPLPIDADKLPSVVKEYRTPFRLLPHGVRRSLRDKEMTYYRRSARTMPPHFALGRSRELQGLALAMIKLWEKSALVKIAIKRGIQNTNNERMAEELKVLTGGTLVSRNKDYIVFYRGNDFLSPRVKDTLVEAKKSVVLYQDEEELARERATTFINANAVVTKRPLVAGTLIETMAATSRWANHPSPEDLRKMMKESAVARRGSLVKFLEIKLARAKEKIQKAENAILKVQRNKNPAELPTDLETLSNEERFLFRKMGLSMKPFVPLGRRGVFGGTVENMHFHWKYRELVKIVVERKNLAQVRHIAISLESESGGVLVSVEKFSKGHAIIIYRGKNYQRPDEFRPKNLLTKRQALARSIELQRREALKHHVWELQDKVAKLKTELRELENVEEVDEATLYSRINNESDDEDDDDDCGGGSGVKGRMKERSILRHVTGVNLIDLHNEKSIANGLSRCNSLMDATNWNLDEL